jgi:hypothetical protein
MAGLGSQKIAADLRDAVERISAGVVNDLRPDPFLAKVYDFDLNTQKAQVVRSGETTENLIPVHFGLDKIPQVKMITTFSTLGEDAPGDIVRVGGKPGSYFLIDYFYGSPLPQIASNTDAVHKNPSFEDARWSGGYPPEWSSFWNNGAWSVQLDNADKVHGSFALKIFRPASGTVRVLTKDAYPVLPGELVSMSCQAKADSGSGVLNFGLLSGTTAGEAQYFGGGTIQGKSFFTSTAWNRYSADFIVPTGHTFVRFDYMFNVWGTEVAKTFWIDDTRSSRNQAVPWINMDGTSPGASSILSSLWTPYGGVFEVPRYRRVGDEVEVEGLAQVASGGGLTVATLPIGYRPLKAHVSTILGNGDVSQRCDVRPDGAIALYSITAAGYYSLDGIRFSVT